MATGAQKLEFLNKILLPLVGKHKIADLKVIGFLASQGNKYSKELMLVGRATNGWGVNEIVLRNLVGDTAEKYAQEVFDSVSSIGECPMS